MSKKNLQQYICTIAILFILLMLGGCHGMSKSPYQKIDFVIGVSQANMREPWRLVLMNELKEELSKYDNINLITMDASNNTDKQKEDVDKMLKYNIDLLIISPCDAVKMTPVISEVYKKIPVIVMDKAVEGFEYTLFIGPDNKMIGRQAGEDVVKLLDGGNKNVLELCGNEETQANKDKSAGFEAVISQYKGLHIIKKRVGTELRDEAEDIVNSMGDSLKDIDLIFAHNDYMALGAYNAVHGKGYDTKIIGIDGFSGQSDGINLVKQGKLDETVACSTGGKEAIQYAIDILNHVKGVPKQIILRSHSITADKVDDYEVRLNKIPKEYKKIIDVGYSQVGTESAWRLANTRSIKEAAKDMGVNLIIEDANQSQKKQIEYIRKFIAMKVDVIVISPVVDNGWSEVLNEAKEAGIPVILSDRKVNVNDDSLYTTFIGADFLEEGRRAMRWVRDHVTKPTGNVRILEIQGTLESSPANERKLGFEEVMKENPGYQIVYSESGDFTYEGGKEIVRKYLQSNPWNIDVIYSHNDDMALGAIEELEKHDIKPGIDVKIVSVDGTRKAFKAMVEGKLNCVVECNPLLGPQLIKAIKDLMNGKELPLRIITEEKVYTQEQAKELIKGREY